MFTLIRNSPTLFSSALTLSWMCLRNSSLSWLICSMVIEATVRRSCPKMISSAVSSMSTGFRPNRRSAALAMILGSVETPMVKVLGTWMRMFCWDSAFLRSILIVIGFSERKA